MGPALGSWKDRLHQKPYRVLEKGSCKDSLHQPRPLKKMFVHVWEPNKLLQFGKHMKSVLKAFVLAQSCLGKKRSCRRASSIGVRVLEKGTPMSKWKRKKVQVEQEDVKHDVEFSPLGLCLLEHFASGMSEPCLQLSPGLY